jgi:hypothetical protein
MKPVKVISLIILLLISVVSHAQTWTESAHVKTTSRIGHGQLHLGFSQGTAVSGFFYDENATIFEKNNSGEWIPTIIQEVNPPNHSTPPNFGYSSAIYKGTVVVGSPGDDLGNGQIWPGLDTGALFVFEKDGSGNWVQKQKLLTESTGYRTNYEFLGVSVAIHGKTIAAGANWSESLQNGDQYNDGSVYVFEQDASGVWQKKQVLNAPDKTNGDFFGYSISIYEKTMIIGANKNETNLNPKDIVADAGAAYIFEKDNSGTWVFKQKITASVRSKDATFGESVSVYDRTIVVGTHDEPFGVMGGGAAYVFTKDDNGIWQETQRLVASDLGYFEYFGTKVAVGADVIAIGAHAENHDEVGKNDLNSAGALYLFTKDATGKWIEHKKICASNRSANNGFGVSVATDGDNIAAMDNTRHSLYFFEKSDLLNQTIMFEELAEVVYNSQPFQLSASTTSSLPIIFSTSDPRIASINGNTVTPKIPGVVTISAHQSGNQTYDPAVVQRTLVVAKASQHVTFDEFPDKLVTDDDFFVTASSSSGMPVTFTSSNPSVASIDQTGKVQVLTVGETVLTASQVGDALTKEASASRTLNVTTVLGVDDQNFKRKFEVYPNPTAGDLFVKIQESIQQPVLYSIYNQMGQIVYKGELRDTINYIDLNPFSSGIFFILLRSDSSTIKARIKVVVK